jgi:hypothetical protein
MKKFVIERNLPGAGNMTPEELKTTSKISCSVLKIMGTDIQWLQSYITGDKIYCIYIASNEELIRQHAKSAGFPANAINEIATIIDPTTVALMI